MRRCCLLLYSLIVCLALAGCSGLGSHDTGLTTGVSTATDVSVRYGPPVRRWTEADGEETLEYSSQPFGQSCYMVRLGRDGKLLAIEDTLQQASRFRVVAGWTPEQVSRLLGKERSRMFFRFSGEDVWDWNVAPDQSGYLLRFNVHFKDGVVLRTSQSMVFPDRHFPSGGE